MAKATLMPLGRDDYDRVRHITVQPEQIVYSGTVAMAFSQDEPGIDFHAVMHRQSIAGFFKIDHKFPDTYDFCEAGDIGLRAFMIDRSHQGKGIGMAAAQAMRSYLAGTYSNARQLVLTVNMRNTAAVRCYQQAGFLSNGDVYSGGLAGPQYVMRLSLT